MIIEPSHNFTQRVMSQLYLVEKQRQRRMNIAFALVASAPLTFRWFWFLIRRDFISVTELPFGTTLTQIYTAFLSPLTAYAFVIGGIFIAIMLVGLPQWRTVRS